MSLPDPLVPLVTAWRSAVRTPRRRAITAGALLFVAAMLLVARGGTTRARLGAAGALAVVTIGVAFVLRRDALGWADPHRAIDRLAGSVDPAGASRAQRALGLLDPDRARHEGTSPQLAALHVQRALAALPSAAIERGANRVAARFATATLVFAVGVLAIAVLVPWPVFEGFDVLLARDRVAPLAMEWLDEATLHSRPPDYLHQTEYEQPIGGELTFARGTLLTLRGAPIHAGRRLVLTDGASEVPFVDDGQGAVVARWPLEETVDLRIVARFGEVGIREATLTRVTSIPDQVPVVTLEGAPKRIELAHDEDASQIAIRYHATDDHGLREVHLVLRSGPREERRVLARLDGETRADEGGYVLRATDSFIKKSHVPVEVRVEAKDNDPITGPKWGASPAFTIVPPDVGEPQAIRLDALRALRDRFVDSLASRMEHPVTPGLDKGSKRALLAEEGKTVDDDADLLEATVDAQYAGIRVPGRLQALLRGQMRKVREAMTKEAHAASPQTHAALVTASEKIALVADAIVSGLGQRDTRTSSKQLADVADDVALGETQEARDAERDRGRLRADAAVSVLTGGAKSMRRLGELGRDIGEIVASDVSRIERGRGARDWEHAELAARDLAARLREPDPSFGGARGGPSKGGGESGGQPGEEGEAGDKGGADDVEQAFNEAAQDLEQLAQDHANAMSKTENALSNGASQDDVKAMADEAKKHADKVREAVRELPSVGAGSETASGKSAAAREQAEQMARALEQGSPADAVSSGKNALQSLDEAERAARGDPWRRWNNQGTDTERAIDAAKKNLEPEIAWAEQKVADLRKKAAERAKGELSSQGEQEGAMAERARQLGDKGHAEMPSGALDALEEAQRSMQHAAEELRSGDPDKAVERQREAQRQLEMAKQAMGGNDEDGNDQGDPSGDRTGNANEDPAARTDIPKADDHKGPEDFRRRVTDGLSKPSSGRLKDAVRRYAEGLLR